MAQRRQFDLKKFRKAVAVLKAKGIIKNVDARTAQPYFIRQGHKLSDQVKKFDDVVSGKVEPVKLPQAKLRAYKKAGYETEQGNVLVPKLATDKVTVTKDNEIKIVSKSEGGGKVTRIKLAVPYNNLKQWLTDMKKNHLRIDAMKRKQEYFGYKIAEHTSWNLYRTIDFLIEEITNGTTSGLNLSDKIRHTTHKQQNEFFEAFEIVRVSRPEAWPLPPTRKRGGPTSKKARKAYLKRIKGTPKGEAMRAANRERQQKFRDSMSKKEREKYNRDARHRRKKKA